jgi:hypothetical protein
VFEHGPTVNVCSNFSTCSPSPPPSYFHITLVFSTHIFPYYCPYTHCSTCSCAGQ